MRVLAGKTLKPPKFSYQPNTHTGQILIPSKLISRPSSSIIITAGRHERYHCTSFFLQNTALRTFITLTQFHQLEESCKLQKARPFLLIFQNVVIYKTTKLFKVYALRYVVEIESLVQFHQLGARRNYQKDRLFLIDFPKCCYL